VRSASRVRSTVRPTARTLLSILPGMGAEATLSSA
jgi:hypothetical protein